MCSHVPSPLFFWRQPHAGLKLVLLLRPACSSYHHLQVLRFQASKHHAHLLRILYQSGWPAAAYLSQVSQDLVILILGCQFAISSSFCSVAYIPLQDSRVDKYNYRLFAAGNNERYLSFKFTKNQGCFKRYWENKSKDLTLCVFKIILKMLKALQESW